MARHRRVVAAAPFNVHDFVERTHTALLVIGAVYLLIVTVPARGWLIIGVWVAAAVIDGELLRLVLRHKFSGKVPRRRIVARISRPSRRRRVSLVVLAVLATAAVPLLAGCFERPEPKPTAPSDGVVVTTQPSAVKL